MTSQKPTKSCWNQNQFHSAFIGIRYNIFFCETHNTGKKCHTQFNTFLLNIWDWWYLQWLNRSRCKMCCKCQILLYAPLRLQRGICENHCGLLGRTRRHANSALLHQDSIDLAIIIWQSIFLCFGQLNLRLPYLRRWIQPLHRKCYFTSALH